MALKNYFLKHSHDPKRPSFGPTMKIFNACLFWAPDRNKKQSFVYYTALIFATVFGLNQLLFIGIERKPELILAFLQISGYHLGIVKFLAYEIYHKTWEKAINTISKLEIEEMEDMRCRKIVTKYISYSRTVLICFWILAIISFIAFYSKRWLLVVKDAEVDDTKGISDKVNYFWWPSDLGGRQNMYMYMMLQNLYGGVGFFYVLAWDPLCTITFIAIAGQIKVVALKFRHALDDDDQDELQMKENLIQCHKQYLSLKELQQSCNEALSPVLFVHLLVVSINIAVLISYMGPNSQLELSTVLLFIFGLYVQLYLYYWHGNEVTVQSELVSEGVLDSNWLNKSNQIRKLIVLLSIATSKKIVFFAGPFHSVSLRTFAAIVRASYTFYTFMSETA